MPSLRQIQYFLTVADLGGFTPAASALHVAQSALSRQIGQLEDELGFPLFDRGAERVRLTPAGTLYRDRVASIPATLTAAADEGAQLSRGEAGVLRLLHSSTVPVGSLMPVLERFMRACPAHGSISTARRPRIRCWRSRTATPISGSFVCRCCAAIRACASSARGRTFSAAVPADHPLAGRKRMAIARLRHEPFVSAVYRERAARVVIDLCLKRGFVPATARIVSPKTSMLNLVAAGHGVAIVPERMASLGIDGVVFVPISDEDAIGVRAGVAGRADGAGGRVRAGDRRQNANP